MCDMPEDLQIIKREYSTSPTALTSTEPLSDYTIKTKLNLHVKKRLQHDYECNKRNVSNIIKGVAMEGGDNGKSMTINNAMGGEQKKFIRSRKSYHKRVEKNKLSSDISKERKCKYKLKQLVVNKETDVPEETATNVNTVGAVDDDDGSNENDIRIVRDKEKHPDVLSMILSMKKRALFANSEVQKFLGSIMTIMKT